jgi:hypothetical protein
MVIGTTIRPCLILPGFSTLRIAVPSFISGLVLGNWGCVNKRVQGVKLEEEQY